MARVTLVPKTGLLPFLHRFPYYTTRNASWYKGLVVQVKKNTGGILHGSVYDR